MKNNLKRNINYIIIILSSILYIYMMFASDIKLGTGRKELENILILAIPCFMLLMYSLNTNNKKSRKKVLIFYLLFYVLALLGFTFANFRVRELITEGIMEKGYNLIPFNTIISMFDSSIGLSFALYNIIGNFLMLTPLSILLPMIDDRYKKIKNYLFITILISILIELAQYVTEIGNLDIDDFILNISGSYIFYLIIFKTKLYDHLYKLFYKITIPSKVCNIIYYILLITIIFIYSWYLNILYNNEKENNIGISNLVNISETTS